MRDTPRRRFRPARTNRPHFWADLGRLCPRAIDSECSTFWAV